jgi:hypothetical protein
MSRRGRRAVAWIARNGLRAAAPLVALLAACVPAQAASSSARSGDAVALVSGTQALLGDREIVHSWRTDPRGTVLTTALADPLAGRQWSASASPEFSITLDSLSTTSTDAWRLLGATAQRTPVDPARPAADSGVEIVFRYGLAGQSLELDRTWSLYPGSAVQAVASTLVNRTPAAVRVGQYSLAELSSPARAIAEVQTYHGGSDWRQDFRVTKRESGPFDDEGEIAQFDDGRGAGWFLVGERRSGAMSRVGRSPTGRTWVGVDNARDLLDLGPLLTSPPSYNRLENPAYPVPVRQRTLLPYGALELGRAYLGVYHGGASEAAAAFATDFASHEMPAFARTVDLNTFHPWGHGSGLSDANLRREADVFKALGGETFMLDDQWQGKSAGDWQWDAQRFPTSSADGVPDFVHYLHAHGLALGLWMSPAEFNPSSRTYAEHPTWACTPTGDVTARIPDDSGLGVWDMTAAPLRAHLSSVIDRLIAQDGVREFKFDYVTWVDCPPHDYLDYEDAYVAWVREQERRHPGVSFELDETNDQRLWPLRSVALGPSWFDNGHLKGSSYPARLLHDIWSAAPWIGPSTLGFGTYDGTLAPPYTADYLMPIALLGHVTFWSDLTRLSRAQADETAWWIAWYEAHRQALAGLAYEDTAADPLDGSSFAAFQPWSGDHGFVFAFRQGGSARDVTIPLQGLRSSESYRVSTVRSATVLGTFTGAQLERGLALTMPERYSALVLSLEPISVRRSPAAHAGPRTRRPNGGARRRRSSRACCGRRWPAAVRADPSTVAGR